jgi:hypothetical protein
VTVPAGVASSPDDVGWYVVGASIDQACPGCTGVGSCVVGGSVGVPDGGSVGVLVVGGGVVGLSVLGEGVVVSVLGGFVVPVGSPPGSPLGLSPPAGSSLPVFVLPCFEGAFVGATVEDGVGVGSDEAGGAGGWSESACRRGPSASTGGESCFGAGDVLGAGRDFRPVR